MKATMIILLVITSTMAYPQGKGELSLSVGKSENDMIHFTTLDGAASVNGYGGYKLNLGYSKPLTTWLSLNMGVELANYKFSIAPMFTDPRIDILPMNEQVFLIAFPVGLKTEFLRFFHFDANVLLDIDPKSHLHLDNQSGIGANAGFGFHYRYKERYGIYITPFITMHSIVPFTFAGYHRRLFESGLNLGLSYKL